MKKILSLTLALATVSVSCYAEVGNTPLSQKINNVLHSEEYSIRYQPQAHIFKNQVLAQNAFAKQPSKLVNMLVKNSNTKACISEMYTDDNALFSVSMNIMNGTDIYVGAGRPAKGKVLLDTINKTPAELRKYINIFVKPSGNTDMYARHNASMEKFVLGYFPAFISLEPSTEYVRMQDGTMQMRESKPFSYCVNYSKSGSQTINEIYYQFEEYKSPVEDDWYQICRYYFVNGELAKVVQKIAFVNKETNDDIEKSMESAVNGFYNDKVTVINIYEFNPVSYKALLAIPSKSKVMKM